MKNNLLRSLFISLLVVLLGLLAFACEFETNGDDKLITKIEIDADKSISKVDEVINVSLVKTEPANAVSATVTITKAINTGWYTVGEQMSMDLSNLTFCLEFKSNDIGATIRTNDDNTFDVVSSKAGVVEVRAFYNFYASSLVSSVFGRTLESNVLSLTFTANEIKTPEDLMELSDRLNESFILANDIDLDGISWTPIGSASNPFTGILDGDGYSIKNLTYTASNTNGAGLFGNLNGTVKNIKLEVSLNANYAGGIAGITQGLAVITNCEVSGVLNRQFGEYIGGIVGKQNGGVIEDCKNTAVVQGSKWIGGIVGWTDKELTDCINTGAVSGVELVGGIAGRGFGAKDCLNEGEITASGDRVGGIIGESSGVEITDCISTGEVTGRNYVGGALGYGIINITGYSNTSRIVGKAYVGGVAGYSSQISDCTNSGAVIADGTIVNGLEIDAFYGGLAGFCSNLINSTNSGVISYIGTGNYVGGLAGYVSGEVKNCINTADVDSLGNYTGGITGYLRNGTIINAQNSGRIVGESYVGGICGFFFSAYGVSGCDNSNEIIALKDYAGGILGSSNGNIESCANSGSISGRYYVGGFAGRAKNLTSLSNTVEVSGVAYVGGIAGYISGNVLGCENEGIITASGTFMESSTPMAYLGGISGTALGFIKSCINRSNITYTGTGFRVGGISGYAFSLENCTNTGIITSESDYVGGIAGQAGDVSSCENMAGITAKSYVGGIAGCANDNAIYLYCENNALITGESYVGGIVGYARANSKYNNCENHGNIIGFTNLGGITGAKGNGVQENSCTDTGLINS